MRFWRLHYSLHNIIGQGKARYIGISEITQKASILLLSIFSTLIVVTAWVHATLYYIQNYYDLSFFDVFYTIAVSSTSGLSTQIIPDNIFSRIVTLYIMVVGAIFIPTNLSNLLTLINSKSAYTKPFQKSSAHVVLAGNFEITSLRGFLREFFSGDHLFSCGTSIVMLNPNEPDEELQMLLADPVYSDRVTYVKGSAISFRSFHKVRLMTAHAVFLFCNVTEYEDLTDAESDATTVMRALAMRKFRPDLTLFAQIIRPRSKIHLIGLVDHTLCIDEFKMGMMAQNCLFPGYSTLLYLLTTSISASVFDNLNYPLEDDEKEYLDGAMQEIYEIKLSMKYAGMSFIDCSILIYRKYGASLMGLGIKIFDQPIQIMISPCNYIIKGGEHAFIITTDFDIAKRIEVVNHESSSLGDIESGFHSISNEELVEEVESSCESRLQLLPQEILPIRDESSYSSSSLSMGVDKRKRIDKLNSNNNMRGHVEEDGPKIHVASKSTSRLKEVLADDLSDQQSMHTVTAITLEKQKIYMDSAVLNATTVFQSMQPPDDINAHLPPIIPKHLPLPDVFNAAEPITKMKHFLVSSHLLFCSLSPTFPSNLAYFIVPFRRKHQCPIVFLSPSTPELNEWEHLQSYGDIHHVQGTGLLRKDLAKANIQLATHCIILANTETQIQHDLTADSLALLALLNVQALTDSNPYIMIEFIHTDNMKYIGSSSIQKQNLGLSDVHQLSMHVLFPAFMAGHVFSRDMFHSILAQSYYTPNLLPFMKVYLF